jgi:hypothetical protein
MQITDLDEWQQDVINETEKHIAIRTGRQVGKTTAISVKAAEFAIKNPDKTVLVIASVERQAQNLFEKIMDYVYDNYRHRLKMGKDKPTKHKVTFTNGSVIHCVPTGLDGHGIRGYTVDLLIADEAAFIQEPVWAAVTPMLAVTKGQIVLLSTPFGKAGFFYERFKEDYEDTWKTVHLTSLECSRVDKKHIEEQRKSMSELEFAQEYLGEFVDDLRQLFSDELIRKCMTLEKSSPDGSKCFLGVDVARFGGDENTFVTVKLQEDKVYMKDLEITSSRDYKIYFSSRQEVEVH